MIRGNDPVQGSARNWLGFVARWLGRLGALALVVCIGVEAGVRLFLPPTESPLRRSFLISTRRDRTPYTMFGRPPYNGPTPSTDKPAGEFRVVMLGGSTVEMGDPAIAGYLETELRTNGMPAARVFNYGATATNSGQELARLVFDVVDLHPDVVIIYDGANDIISPFLGDPRPGYPFDFFAWERNPILIDDVRHYPTVALAAFGSATLRRCCGDYFTRRFTNIEALRRQTAFPSRSWQDATAHAYTRNVLKAARVCSGFGIRFFGFFQPTVYYKEPRTESEERMLDDKTEAAMHTREVVLADFAQARRDALIGEQTVVDLSDAFDGIRESVFWNSVHINQPYNLVIARRMRETLMRGIAFAPPRVP